MQSLSSILEPAASAARHLAQALTVARSDFTAQANKTRRHVAGDLDHARDDLGEATLRLSEVLGDTVAAIREASATYRDDVHSIYEARVRNRRKNASAILRHPYLTAGMALGMGCLAWATWHSRRLQLGDAATKDHDKKPAKDTSSQKSAGRRARPAKHNAQQVEDDEASEEGSQAAMQ